jgi:hypothetical protein
MAFSGTFARDQAGTIVGGLATHMTRRLKFLQDCGITHAVCEYGINDLVANIALATLQASLVAIWSSLAAVVPHVYQSTLTARTASTDGFKSVAGQTPTAGASFSGGATSIRSQLNTGFRTVPAPLADYIELADAVETARDSGVFIVGDCVLPHMTAPAPGTVTAGSTTTAVNCTLPGGTSANQFLGGRLFWLTGALAGTNGAVTSNTTVLVTLTVAAASAPVAGDTFRVCATSVTSTADGTHPSSNKGVPSNTGFYGGVLILADVFAAKVSGWTV